MSVILVTNYDDDDKEDGAIRNSVPLRFASTQFIEHAT